MTRDALEAAIWRAMTRHRIRGPSPAAFVGEVLAAADKHAAHIGGITAERRAALAVAAATAVNRRSPAPRKGTTPHGKIHRRDPHYSRKTLCGLSTQTRQVTFDKELVTCQRCNPQAKEASRA